MLDTKDLEFFLAEDTDASMLLVSLIVADFYVLSEKFVLLNIDLLCSCKMRKEHNSFVWCMIGLWCIILK